MMLSRQATDVHKMRPVRLHHYKRQRPTDQEMSDHRSSVPVRELKAEQDGMQPVRIHHKRKKIFQPNTDCEAEDHQSQEPSKFWSLPQEIRDMIYDLTYPDLPRDVVLRRPSDMESRCEDMDQYEEIQKISKSMTISKRYFLELMTHRSRFTTFHLDLSTPSSSRCLARWRYIRTLHIRLDLRRAAFGIASLSRSCPGVETLRVELVHSGVFGCHDRVWPRGLEESELATRLMRWECLRELDVGLVEGNFGIVCAGCRNVVRGMGEFVMRRRREGVVVMGSRDCS